jgi:hypothetical protein
VRQGQERTRGMGTTQVGENVFTPCRHKHAELTLCRIPHAELTLRGHTRAKACTQVVDKEQGAVQGKLSSPQHLALRAQQLQDVEAVQTTDLQPLLRHAGTYILGRTRR